MYEAIPQTNEKWIDGVVCIDGFIPTNLFQNSSAVSSQITIDSLAPYFQKQMEDPNSYDYRFHRILSTQFYPTPSMISSLPPTSSYQAFYINRSGMDRTGPSFPNYVDEQIDDGEQTFDYEELTDDEEEKVSKVEIYDLTGKIQFSQKFEDKTISLDTDLIGLNESGMYLCKLWVNNKSIVKKIVILK